MTSYDDAARANEIHRRGARSTATTPAIETAVRLGAGFAMFPDFSVGAALATGEWVPLCRDFHLKAAGIWLRFPSSRYRSVTLGGLVTEPPHQLKPT